MKSISRLVLAALALAGTIMASSPLAMNNHAAEQSTAKDIYNMSEQLLTIMANSNSRSIYSDVAQLRKEFFLKHANAHQNMLFLSCSTYTDKRQQRCYKNLVFVTLDDAELLNKTWIKIPLIELARAYADSVVRSSFDNKFDRFAIRHKTRLLLEIPLGEKWTLAERTALIGLRYFIQLRTNGDAEPVQDAVSATLCHGINAPIKPASNAARSPIPDADLLQILDFLRNPAHLGPVWLDAFNIISLYDRISLPDLLTGAIACYRARPNLRDITVALRTRLSADSMAKAIDELDSHFSFNQNLDTSPGSNTATQLANRFSYIKDADIYLAVIKFVLLDLHKYNLLTSLGISAERPKELLALLMQYWALERLERHQGAEMVKLAFAAMKANGLMRGVIDFESLKRMVQSATPDIGKQ